MTRFTCDGFRAVHAESASEAAHVFAERLARRKYGRLGRVGALSQEGHTYHSIIYQTFIGSLDRKSRSISGHNEWLTRYWS